MFRGFSTMVGRQGGHCGPRSAWQRLFIPQWTRKQTVRWRVAGIAYPQRPTPTNLLFLLDPTYYVSTMFPNSTNQLKTKCAKHIQSLTPFTLPSRIELRLGSFWKIWLARALTRSICCHLWMHQKPRWREESLGEKRMHCDPGLWRESLGWVSQHLQDSEQLWSLLKTVPSRELLLRTFQVHLMALGLCWWLWSILQQETHMNTVSATPVDCSRRYSLHTHSANPRVISQLPFLF